MSVYSRSRKLSSTTDEVRLKLPVAHGRAIVIARISGTFVGTIKIQTSDDGKTWADGLVILVASSGAASGNPTTTGTYACLLGAAAVAGRVIFSAYTSGEALVEALYTPYQA